MPIIQDIGPLPTAHHSIDVSITLGHLESHAAASKFFIKADPICGACRRTLEGIRSVARYLSESDIVGDMIAAGLAPSVGQHQITVRRPDSIASVSCWADSGEWVVTGPRLADTRAFFDNWADALAAIHYRLATR
jgi:hypothetical protein